MKGCPFLISQRIDHFNIILTKCKKMYIEQTNGHKYVRLNKPTLNVKQQTRKQNVLNIIVKKYLTI